MLLAIDINRGRDTRFILIERLKYSIGNEYC